MTVKENNLHNKFVVFYIYDYGHVGWLILSGKVKEDVVVCAYYWCRNDFHCDIMIDHCNSVHRRKGFNFIREILQTVSYWVTVFSDMSCYSLSLILSVDWHSYYLYWKCKKIKDWTFHLEYLNLHKSALSRLANLDESTELWLILCKKYLRGCYAALLILVNVQWNNRQALYLSV